MCAAGGKKKREVREKSGNNNLISTGFLDGGSAMAAITSNIAADELARATKAACGKTKTCRIKGLLYADRKGKKLPNKSKYREEFAPVAKKVGRA